MEAKPCILANSRHALRPDWIANRRMVPAVPGQVRGPAETSEDVMRSGSSDEDQRSITRTGPRVPGLAAFMSYHLQLFFLPTPARVSSLVKSRSGCHGLSGPRVSRGIAPRSIMLAPPK